MAILTLSRQYGAGGLEVGQRLALRLSYDFMDSRLLDEVARRLKLPEEVVRSWDERREGLVLRLFRALQSAHPEYAAPTPMVEGAPTPDPDRVAEVVREVILEEARGNRAVIVGRGAAFILRGFADAHHFRLVAPREARIARVAQRLGLPSEEAAKQVDQADKERVAWIRHFWNADANDAIHYSLVVNTQALGVERSVEVILRAAGLPE